VTLDFTPRFLTAPEYLRALHEPQDCVAILVRNRTRQRTTQRIASAEAIASEPFQSWLAEQNAAGADIFVGMNPLRASSRCRTKENIREVRHLYLDLDEDAGASLHAIRASGDIPAPNFVLDTSPSRNQVIWRVQNFDLDEGERTLRALASRFGGDPAATDVSRLLRLPGFRNRKYKDPFIVQAFQETDVVHRSGDFRIQEDSPESPRTIEDATHQRRLQVGHRSQSEADWAYAKRALARGDSPEHVIQNIADYRAEDKADPLYYARLTVTKAQLALKQGMRDHVAERHAVPVIDRGL
jgi:hypothetical protein